MEYISIKLIKGQIPIMPIEKKVSTWNMLP